MELGIHSILLLCDYLRSTIVQMAAASAAASQASAGPASSPSAVQSSRNGSLGCPYNRMSTIHSDTDSGWNWRPAVHPESFVQSQVDS